MRILFLSHYFPPEVNAPASRTFEHCREWVRLGHDVTVVTCTPNHPRGEVYEGYRNRLFQRDEREGVKIIRVWTYLSANEGFAKRTLNYISFMLMSILIVPWMPKADVLVTTSPQFFNGLAGYFVSRLKRMKWVLEIRDLWPESILAVGAIDNGAVIATLKWLEKFAYSKADHIIPVTDAFERHIRQITTKPCSISVIKNGADLSLYDSDGSDGGLREKLGLQGKTVAAYFGTHGMAHHLETILEAAHILSENTEIVFLMIGDGAEREKLVSLKESIGLNNVLILGQQPKEQMPNYWALCDIALVLLRKTDLFKTVIPSKIFEAMAMRKPIILGVEGESKDIVQSAGAGTAIPPENAEELAKSVVALSEKEVARKMGASGENYVKMHFDRKILAKKYAEVLTSVAGSSN